MMMTAAVAKQSGLSRLSPYKTEGDGGGDNSEMRCKNNYIPAKRAEMRHTIGVSIY
jgi:hypothetical protein